MKRLLLLLLFVIGLPLAAEPLPDGGLDLWPQLRVHADPEGRLNLASARRQAYAPPEVPRGNFGPRQGALWLRIDLPAEAVQRHWLLEIDYPPLQQVDAWLLQGDEVAALARMGSQVPMAERPLRSRAPAWPLRLEAGLDYRLYLRVQSHSTLVLPLRLHETERFVEIESRRMLLQGLIFGVLLMLLAFSLVNGLSLRDPLFGWYALLLLGLALFFASFNGLDQPLLGTLQHEALIKLAPLGALLAVAGGSLFARSALSLPQQRPRMAALLAGIGLLGLSAFALALIGVLDYRQASLTATLLGPLAIFSALAESLRVARHGPVEERRLGAYVALGWLLYAGGSACMALLLRGRLAMDFWTLHALQFAALLEMFVWMRVLSLRVEQLRLAAERSAQERRELLSLAHSDALTGLANRRGLDERLGALLQRPEAGLALFVLDLDGFKAVNDAHGHEVGDRLLRAVAQRLRTHLRGGDLLARIGGDEFVVVSPGLRDPAAALRLGQKLVDALAQPFTLGKPSARIGASAGLALAPENGTDAETLLRKADAAMYAAKQAGKGRVARA